MHVIELHQICLSPKTTKHFVNYVSCFINCLQNITFFSKCSLFLN